MFFVDVRVFFVRSIFFRDKSRGRGISFFEAREVEIP